MGFLSTSRILFVFGPGGKRKKPLFREKTLRNEMPPPRPVKSREKKFFGGGPGGLCLPIVF